MGMSGKRGQIELLHEIMLDAQVEREMRAIIRRRIPRELRHQIEVDDAWQDLWVALEEDTPTLRSPERESDLCYLQRVLESVLSDLVRFMRARKRGGDRRQVPWRAITMLPADEESPDIPAWQHERAAMLRQAMTGLTEKQREIIRLIYLDGMSVEEAARCSGRTKSAVLKIRARAIEALRPLLTPLWPRGGTTAEMSALLSERRTGACPGSADGPRMDRECNESRVQLAPTGPGS